MSIIKLKLYQAGGKKYNKLKSREDGGMGIVLFYNITEG